jgi:hypothetical protein
MTGNSTCPHSEPALDLAVEMAQLRAQMADLIEQLGSLTTVAEVFYDAGRAAERKQQAEPSRPAQAPARDRHGLRCV